MTASRRRTRFWELATPRLLNEEETAHYLGMSRTSFARSIDELEKNNFPRRHPVLKKRDRHTIDVCLDRAYGIIDETELVNSLVVDLIKKIGNG